MTALKKKIAKKEAKVAKKAAREERKRSKEEKRQAEQDIHDEKLVSTEGGEEGGRKAVDFHLQHLTHAGSSAAHKQARHPKGEP